MAAGVSAALVASCAPAQPISQEPAQAASLAAERRCFNASNVNGFQVVDSRTVDLTIGAGRIYRLELLGVCPDVRDAVGVAVRTRGGSSYVCEDNDLELVVPSQTGPRVCPATGLRQRSAQELAAERATRR
jgi:hypothetical protein